MCKLIEQQVRMVGILSPSSGPNAVIHKTAVCSDECRNIIGNTPVNNIELECDLREIPT